MKFLVLQSFDLAWVREYAYTYKILLHSLAHDTLPIQSHSSFQHQKISLGTSSFTTLLLYPYIHTSSHLRGTDPYSMHLGTANHWEPHYTLYHWDLGNGQVCIQLLLSLLLKQMHNSGSVTTSTIFTYNILRL